MDTLTPDGMRARQNRPSPTKAAIGGFLILVTLLLVEFRDLNQDLAELALVVMLAAAGLFFVALGRGRGVQSASFMYSLIFILFHGGLVVVVGLFGSEHFINPYTYWFTLDAVREATHALIWGVAALALGISIGGRNARFTETDRPKWEIAPARQRGVGWALLVVGFSLIGSTLINAGISNVLQYGYIEILEALEGSGNFGTGTLLVSLGFGFLVSVDGRTARVALAIFAVYGAIGFALGFRGTILFTGAVLFVVKYRNRKIRSWLFGMIVVVTLIGISVVRTTRAGGFRSLLDADAGMRDMLAGIAEMGHSIYPIVVVQDWLAQGESLRGGVTFIAPVARAIEGILGPFGALPLSPSVLFNVEIMERVGPIGGSPIAEALRNWGVVGPFVVMLVVGLVIGRLDRLSHSTSSAMVMVVVLLPFFIAIRNSFAPIVFQLVIGAVALLVVHKRAKASESVESYG